MLPAKKIITQKIRNNASRRGVSHRSLGNNEPSLSSKNEVWLESTGGKSSVKPSHP
jgi:beta-lactamase class D